MGTRGPKPGQRFGGRQKGQKNKATRLKEQGHAELVEAAAAAGETPLEYMLRVMRTSSDTRRKDAMAIAAAPFVHAKMASVEMKAEVDATVSVSRIELVAPFVESDDHAAH
jgi:hypothetical protein